MLTYVMIETEQDERIHTNVPSDAAFTNLGLLDREGGIAVVTLTPKDLAALRVHLEEEHARIVRVIEARIAAKKEKN